MRALPIILALRKLRQEIAKNLRLAWVMELEPVSKQMTKPINATKQTSRCQPQAMRTQFLCGCGFVCRNNKSLQAETSQLHFMLVI